jgi:hypothetical protein
MIWNYNIIGFIKQNKESLAVFGEVIKTIVWINVSSPEFSGAYL